MNYITAGDYFMFRKEPVRSMLKDSVKEADYAIENGEKVNYALMASASFGKEFHPAVIVVTTHRLLCCSCVADIILASLPYESCIGIGDGKGLILKRVSIHCAGVSVSVETTSEKVSALRAALLDAIEIYPNQKPISFSPKVFIQAAAERERVNDIKNVHQGERRLGKAEAVKYGKCPDCGGSVWVEKESQIYCLKCGHKSHGDK